MIEEVNKEIVISKVNDLQKILKEYSDCQDSGRKQQIDAIISTLNILLRTLK